MKRDSYLLIDGYNVINGCRELAKWADDIAFARDKLIDAAADYSAFRGYRAIVVFDAPAMPGPESEETISGITVVFTEENETADSYIERRAYSLAHGGAEVFVVTSDAVEQSVILGAGAYRIPVREFWGEIELAKARRREEWQARPLGDRSELGGRLSEDVLRKLDAWRKSTK